MLIFQKLVTEEDMRLNPRVLYLFGDNVSRRGRGGQAKVMRGKPNACGIATKWLPTTEAHAYFTAEQFGEVAAIISRDFQPALAHAAKGGVVICPSAGLGTDRARLKETCPEALDLIRATLQRLK